MADPVGTVSHVADLVSSTLGSSIALYDAIKNVKSNNRSVREFREATVSLSRVLSSLRERLARSEVDLSALQALLHGCTRLCEECTAISERCLADTDNDKYSLHDSLTLSYHGGNVEQCRTLLAAYTSTIFIIITEVDL